MNANGRAMRTRSRGVTLHDFLNSMERHLQERYPAKRASPREAQDFLDRCVEIGLLRPEVDRDGATRYVPTTRLVLAFGDDDE